MLSNDPIARVLVTTAAAPVSPSSFDTGLILCPKTPVTAEERLRSYSSAAEMLSDGFDAADEAYQAALKYFAASPAPARVLVSCYAASESLSDAFDAVLDLSASFYGVYLCDHEPAHVLALARHMQVLDGSFVLFYAVTGDASAAAAPDSLFARMKDDGNRRAFGLYAASSTDAAAVMGTAMGLALFNADAAFALCYKKVNGIQPTPLTESQVTALKALSANVYVTRGYTRTLLEPGSTASGSRYDEILYVDRIACDLQEAAVALLADNMGKLPQTDETSARFISVFSSVLQGYTAMGVLATSPWRGASVGPLTAGDPLENGFTLWANSYDDQSDADRAAHQAMPVHVALTLAGSVESVVITVNVTV